MSLLDNVLGGIMGGGNANSPMGSVLANLLGGSQGNQSSQGNQMGATGGGLGSLIGMFQQAGLGHIAQSWVGNGPNQPVSPQQLQSVFGETRVNAMASQAGMQPNDFLSQMSQHLPSAVDGMTPNGNLPDEGTVST